MFFLFNIVTAPEVGVILCYCPTETIYHMISQRFSSALQSPLWLQTTVGKKVTNTELPSMGPFSFCGVPICSAFSHTCLCVQCLVVLFERAHLCLLCLSPLRALWRRISHINVLFRLCCSRWCWALFFLSLGSLLRVPQATNWCHRSATTGYLYRWSMCRIFSTTTRS